MIIALRFKVLILLLFVVGFLEASYSKEGKLADIIHNVMKLSEAAEGDDAIPPPDAPVPEDGPPDTPPVEEGPPPPDTPPETGDAVPEQPHNVPEEPEATTTAEPISTKKASKVAEKKDPIKKIKVSLTGFGIFTVSTFCLSAHFILLMLLLTDKMCVSKKKAPALQSPAPVSH